MELAIALDDIFWAGLYAYGALGLFCFAIPALNRLRKDE